MHPRTTILEMPSDEGLYKRVQTNVSWSGPFVYIRQLGQKVKIRENEKLYGLMDGSKEGDFMSFYAVKYGMPFKQAIKYRNALKVLSRIDIALDRWRDGRILKQGKAAVIKSKKKYLD